MFDFDQKSAQVCIFFLNQNIRYGLQDLSQERGKPWPRGFMSGSSGSLGSERLQIQVCLIPMSEFAWLLCTNVLCCGRLSMVILTLEDPLELFVKRRKYFPGFCLVVI